MRRLACVLLVGLLVAPARAGETASTDLEAVRGQIVALEIERALGALEAILGRPGLTDADRVTALDLRAQAHVAGGDLDAAEKDYGAILALSAGYAPRSEVTSKKAMARFAKLKATTVGTLRLTLDPKDSAVSVDGRPATVAPDGVVAVLAGERHVSVTHAGFDPAETTAHAAAAVETPIEIRLVPNARTLVARTDVAGVSVSLDGEPRGVTAGGAPSADSPAELVLADVPIGEHEIRFAKACFATESVPQIVSVDLADRSPKSLPVVAMRPAQARVTATGANYPGELRVDGAPVATLPLTTFGMCPGARKIEVVASGRTVWAGTIAAEEEDVTVDLTPRPNVVLVGSSWPKSWEHAAAGWSTAPPIEPPPGADLTTRPGWGALPLPRGVDLAVAVIPGAGPGGSDRTVVYSPALGAIDDRAAPPESVHPSWRSASLGMTLADGEADAVVAGVAPGGPASKSGIVAGDHVLAIDGKPIKSASAARTVIAALPTSRASSLDVVSPSGPRKVDAAAVVEKIFRPPEGGDAALRAAWASADSAAGGEDGAWAMANLASLLERFGRDSEALAAWRRVEGAAAGGALVARAAYAIGCALAVDGKRPDAVDAFERARKAALAEGDLALAAAAVDRLADLGVAR